MPKQQPSQPFTPDEIPDEQAETLDVNRADTTTAPSTQTTPATNSSPAHAREKGGILSKQQKTRHNPLRAGLAVVAGRTAGAISRRLHMGGGTSIVGVVAQRVYPDIIEHLAGELQHGSIMITGTNGKTTTSSFIAAILRDGGLRVWRNREGSNLTRGIASSLVIRAEPNGHLRRAGQAISILEVDEAALPQLVQAIPPRIIVFTNLFRDQLDRYGEVDSVTSRWQKAIAQLPESTTLVLNADDPAIAQLGDNFQGRVCYYGISELSSDFAQQTDEAAEDERHQVIDTRTCTNCGSDYVYETRFYSHMGHYHCPNCDRKRPTPTVEATRVTAESFDRLHMSVRVNEQEHEIVVPLPGLYNIYNALAAITAAVMLNTDWSPIHSGIEQFKPMFGRGERIQAEGKTMRLLLAKNPTGFNEVLRTLFTDEEPRHLLFVLNDNIADGRDISWIWDVDFERLTGKTGTLIVTGTRAYDLALRLKYAGVSEQDMQIIPLSPLRAQRAQRAQEHKQRRAEKTRAVQEENLSPKQEHKRRIKQAYGLKNALDAALQNTPDGETLFVVPTYTGLLELHHELEQRGFAAHYWEGKDA